MLGEIAAMHLEQVEVNRQQREALKAQIKRQTVLILSALQCGHAEDDDSQSFLEMF